MTPEEKLEKIKALIEYTHNRFGYYSCREYMSDTFKEQLLNVIKGDNNENRTSI